MPVIYQFTASEAVQFLGFSGDPEKAEKFNGFEAAPGVPLPRFLRDFLQTAAGNPLLHGIDLWTEPRWYHTLYAEMDEQIDAWLEEWIERPPTLNREKSYLSYSQISHPEWTKSLPDRLLIGGDDCGAVSYAIRMDALATDEPAVEWNRETEPLTDWHPDWRLSDFLLASVCDALLGRPSELAEDLLTDAGWQFTWHRDGTKALDTFGIDPAQLHSFHSLYPRADEQDTLLSCCIADGEFCVLETVGNTTSMMVLSQQATAPAR